MRRAVRLLGHEFFWDKCRIRLVHHDTANAQNAANASALPREGSTSPLSLPISPATAAHALSPSRTSQNLPSRSPHPRSPLHRCHRQVSPSPSTKKNAFRSALHLSRAGPEETRALNAAYHQRIHRDQSNLTPWIRRPSSKRLSNCWPATATSKKAWASWP